ncbi:MAG TPA: hypothetical protein VK459_20310, partial [Polyangiaceae bacterium]|nr:hypothetical protein [Polyangiaceae bacterium]
RIRDHVVGFEPPDLCVVRFGETLAYEDGRAVYEEELRLAEEHGAIFVLSDLRGVRSITAEARKIAAELKASPQILGVANFGVSFRIRVLAKLVVTLRRLAGQQIEGFLYMGVDEADARAWIAERRLERARKGG